jgi:hypothetical protein
MQKMVEDVQLLCFDVNLMLKDKMSGQMRFRSINNEKTNQHQDHDRLVMHNTLDLFIFEGTLGEGTG